ncbi:MAG: CPBP family intramembrane metalloprotease [Eubacterium sp.]|nr:CPBP family intramembrane metalloprotease [Eubacterium sp.]
MSREKKKALIDIILLAVGAIVFYAATLAALQGLRLVAPDVYASYTETLAAGGYDRVTLSLPWIVSLFVAPVAEELVFRELLFSRVLCGIARIPYFPSNILQAVVFAAFHMNPVQCAYALVFGIVCGAIYKRHEAHYPVAFCIFFHLCVNLCNLAQLLPFF